MFFRKHSSHTVPWRTTVGNLALLSLPIILYVVGAITIDGFISWNSIVSIVILASFLGIAAIGPTITIIIGGLDLSIASVIGLANVLIISLYGSGWPFFEALGTVMFISIVIGLLNASISLALRIHPIITTLGTGLIIWGGVLSWGHAQVSGAVPHWLTNSVSAIGHTGILPIPGVILLWVVISLMIIVLLRTTRIGHEIYAIGANLKAARFAHVRSKWAWIFTFGLSSFSAALVGVLLAGYAGAPDANIGQPFLFQSIMAVVIGGTTTAGEGGYGNTIIGVLVVVELTTLLQGAGISSSLQLSFFGLMVVFLAALYGRDYHISRRI